MASTTPDWKPVSYYIEFAWDGMTQQHRNGKYDFVCLPSDFKFIILERGLNILAQRYAELIGFHVTIIEDVDSELLLYQRTSQPLPTVSEPAETVWIPELTSSDDEDIPDNPGHTKKVNRNAFILFRADRYPEIKKACPYLVDNDMSIIMRAEWNDIVDRAESDEASAKIREKYLKLSYCEVAAAERSL